MSMSNPNYYQQYKQNAVQSAGSSELTTMLFNGLVKYLMLSIKFIEQNDVTGSHKNLVRSQEIISYLQETLDKNYEISKNLDALYDFMKRTLIQANIKKNAKIVEDVLGMVKELREVWQQAVKKANV